MTVGAAVTLPERLGVDLAVNEAVGDACKLWVSVGVDEVVAGGVGVTSEVGLCEGEVLPLRVAEAGAVSLGVPVAAGLCVVVRVPVREGTVLGVGEGVLDMDGVAVALLPL